MAGSTRGIRRNCEVAASGNDGANSHNSLTVVSGVGAVPPVQSVAMIFDEYCHDNYDDGYSPHERCYEWVQGGLYEYNGANGIVAALGAKVSVFNAHARKNGLLQPVAGVNGKSFGFGAVLAPVEGEGTGYTEMTCHGCLSENQNGGFSAFGPSCIVRLVNCETVGTQTALTSVNSGGTVDTPSYLISQNTRDSGSVQVKTAQNGGVITVKNSAVIA